ncbi:MAG: DMT family transporter [Betaproteobacteria bacterium]|nr:DMT family transporter [Rhodocyclales bacterium]
MPEARPFIGILLMLGAGLCFAALDATSKHLTQTFSVPMLVWARYTVHFVLMLIFLGPSMRARLIATQRPVALTARALMLVGTTGFAMAGISIMPLAESTALLFVTPLIVVMLASGLLKESVSAGRWIAVAAGFAGALLIARPGGALSTQGIILMSLAAGCYAIYQVQTRQMSLTESTVTMLFYTALVGTVAMSLATPLFWRGPMPDAWQGLGIASLGIYGGTGHLLMTRAFRHAPASALSPFIYVQLVWAILLGWLFYDHLPDLLSVAGIAVIAGSSLSIALSERFRPAGSAKDTDTAR